ncbi:serine/arginine repetitive matrix protein 2-like [Drosophila sulfurigaster albostrigata]|uniref:serine/arginine repetitive matrix protein 2-like n=1 Tax=Drosophila sulfurigaster albostrigata TaxID=89887 RepID=UPI002D21C18E|nr:serine/arginine repetitive matrix protein 2-like [Drosophila sulfurigaster albostrigata]
MSSGKESISLCDPKDATQEFTIKVEPNMNDFYLDKDIIEAIDSLHDLFVDILETKNSFELEEEQNARNCGKHKKAKEEEKMPPAPPAPSINAIEESSNLFTQNLMEIFNPESKNSNVVLNSHPKSVKENTKTLKLSDNCLTNLQSPQGSIHNKIIDSHQMVKEDKGWYSPPSSPETSRSMSKNRRFEVGRQSKSKTRNISPRKHLDKRWRSRSNSQNISPRGRRISRSRSKNRNIFPSRKSVSRNRQYRENRRSRSYNRNISARRRRPSRSRSKSRNISPSRKSHFNKRWRSRSYSRSISLRRGVVPRNKDRNERSRTRSANQNNYPSLRELLRSRSKSRNISPPLRHLRRQARCDSRSISSSRGLCRSRYGNDRCRSRSNNSPRRRRCRRSRSKNRNNSPVDKRVSRNRHSKKHWLSNSRSISPNRGSGSRKSNKRWRSRSKSQNISSILDKSKSPSISPNSISTVKDDHSKQHAISKSRNISSSCRKPWRSRSKSRTRVVSRGRSISPQKGSRLRSRRSRSPPQYPHRSYTEQVPREESRSLVHQSDNHISEQRSNLFIPHERALYNGSSPRQLVKARQFVDDTLSHQSYYLPFLKEGNLINTRLTSRPTTLESHFIINPMANSAYQGINHFDKFGYQTLGPHDLRHRLEIRRYYNYEMSHCKMFNYEYLTY